MQPVDEVLAAFDPAQLHLTLRQAQVWALRAHGVSQSQIAQRWGTSRANVCMLERTARQHVARARETIAFDDWLRAPLRFSCRPGALLLDIPPRLLRYADQLGLHVQAEREHIVQCILDQVPDCVRDNRLVRPILLLVTPQGELWVRALRQGWEDS